MSGHDVSLGITSGKPRTGSSRSRIANTTQWECGDSFFTRYSSCSFDRAAHSPKNPLNPLHPSITPFIHEDPLSRSRSYNTKTAAFGSSCTNGDEQESIATKQSSRTRTSTRKQSRSQHTNLPRPALATIDDGTLKDTACTPDVNGVQKASAPDGRTGDGISIMPLVEIGKASRFGDQALVESRNCQVFEAVLQQKEATICPSCVRST